MLSGIPVPKLERRPEAERHLHSKEPDPSARLGKSVIIIASLYQEDKETFMRKISDQTILLATVLFLSFGLIAYFSN